MSSDGYTLAESLAAMLIVGLAVGGLTAGVRTLEQAQRSTARSAGQSTSLAQARQEMDRLLAAAGPFPSGPPTAAAQFTGAASGFDFDCGDSARCGAELKRDAQGLSLELTGPAGGGRRLGLPGVERAHFTYVGPEGASDSWPPQAPDEVQTLRSVVLAAETSHGDVPLTATRLWREQAGDCIFNFVSRDCVRGRP